MASDSVSEQKIFCITFIFSLVYNVYQRYRKAEIDNTNSV